MKNLLGAFGMLMYLHSLLKTSGNFESYDDLDAQVFYIEDYK